MKACRRKAIRFFMQIYAKAQNRMQYTTNSNVNNLQLTKRIFFKLLNEISPNSQAKHLQLAKNMQKNLHISKKCCNVLALWARLLQAIFGTPLPFMVLTI